MVSCVREQRRASVGTCSAKEISSSVFMFFINATGALTSLSKTGDLMILVETSWQQNRSQLTPPKRDIRSRPSLADESREIPRSVCPHLLAHIFILVSCCLLLFGFTLARTQCKNLFSSSSRDRLSSLIIVAQRSERHHIPDEQPREK